MITEFSASEPDLIVKINEDYFHRYITPEQVAAEIRAHNADFGEQSRRTIFGVQVDSSVCLDDEDFTNRRLYNEGFTNEVMIRFARDRWGNPAIRIPAATPRLFRHTRTGADCGYFYMKDFFVVCSFEESIDVLREYSAIDRAYAKQHRLQKVYSPRHGTPIKLDDPVSLFFIKKVISV